ncbi:MAG: ATP-binding protein [Candidatus Roizmanbacteria bacterium]|nr:ATP-binding protein [Candidatus Roizmanbacteria bacterium]
MSLFKPKKKEEKVSATPASAPGSAAKTGPVKTDKIAERFALGMTSVGDIVAPSYVEVDFSHIMVDKHYYTTLFVVGYPRYVGPNWLNPLITFDHPLYISMYIYPTQSKIVLEDLKRKIGEMEATIEGEVRSGKVVDPTVQVALDDALSLQAEIAKGAERFFQFGLYITIPADTKEELETKTKEVSSMLSSLLVISKRAVLEAEEGFKSTLPLFMDQLAVWRNMDTTSLAMTFPFITSSLSEDKGILYGVNQSDTSLVIFDRFGLENANMVVLGKSGGGKSFLVKLDVMRQLMVGVEVIIVDPENEYQNVCNKFGGEYVQYALSSPVRINPFDLPIGEAEEDALANNVLSLHTLMKIIMGELTPEEDALLDKALIMTYQQKGITQDPLTHNNEPPLLEDLYKVLIGMEEPASQSMAFKFEKFIKGSASGIFNSQSNFHFKNKLTVFGIRDLEENLRPVAMYITLNYIWTKVRHENKQRELIIDEAWYLIKQKDTAEYIFNFAKRARKYGLGLTTITQDVEDFLATNEGKAIITNSSMQILLKQSPVAIDKIAEIFYLTSGEKHYLLSSGVGEGLLFAGPSHVAIQVLAAPHEKEIIDG